ncbi:MAG: hypothetical protein IKI12_03195 [Lachnospiraceae bacterium]|nr:hypothetical protein [Lachnospiraceae bacterium]
MRTKRFILLTTILTLLIAGPLLIGGLLLPAQYQDTFMGELPYKFYRLENAPGKRIIVIGGSGMAFAVDSALLEQEFPGCTAINMGMYADLGVKFLLDLTENELREGDIVILSPEQHTQTLSCWFGARSALQGMDGNISMLRYVSREDLGALIGALPGFTLEKLRFMSTGEHPEGDGIYRRSSFNEYGDIASPLASSNIMPGYFDPSVTVSYDPSVLEDAFAERLRSYAAHAHKKGAEVYWYFCPANRLAVDASASPEDFYDFLYETLDFPILGNPANAVMDEAWFFDTDFHLNQSGRTVFTVQLIRDLKAQLGISAPTDIALPQAPALPLTEGKVLTAGTWAGNTSVTEITVPADVVRIEDYAFDGCTGLRTIRLLSEEPSRVLVGDHLLDGCGAVLVVPEGSLTAYRTDYRFSRYADRITEHR